MTAKEAILFLFKDALREFGVSGFMYDMAMRRGQEELNKRTEDRCEDLRKRWRILLE